MNRLLFWAKATTVYGVHSPLLYGLCTDVLAARLPAATRRRLGSRYCQAIYKLCRHYGVGFCQLEPGVVEVLAPEPIVVVRQPHRSPETERRWQMLQGGERYRVAIDCYDYALLLTDRRLHRQHLMLIV
ncbi:MAG: hypothetical protein K5650_02615 [Bacteroidales bacterium]|nr:hypothetical protein [Bacteroidales bacterium]